MKTGWLILAWLLAAVPFVPAQTTATFSRGLKHMAVDGMDDLGAVKLLADRGNPGAQLKLADACMDNRLYANALKWYAAAADQRALDGQFHKGRILLFGCRDGASPDQNVPARPAEGLRYTYLAATNRHNQAWLDLAQALKDGLGCAPNPVEAYAWYMLAADAGNAASHREMNELALRLSVEEIRIARKLAGEMKSGHWLALPPIQTPAQPAVVLVAITLKLSGVVYSPRGNLAIINNRTLGEGESTELPTENKQRVAVTCKRIEPDDVQVQVAGEASARTLFTAAH